MSNGEKIRNMKDDELAMFIMCPAEYDETFNKIEKCNGGMNKNCNECCKRWLKSEVER